MSKESIDFLKKSYVQLRDFARKSGLLADSEYFNNLLIELRTKEMKKYAR